MAMAATSRANGEDRTVGRAARVWSTYQKAVFEDTATGKGHVVVRARAGSGKTSTLEEAVKYVPKGRTILMVAFNKAIAEELHSRLVGGAHSARRWLKGQTGGPRITVSTCHSFGYKQVAAAFGKVRVDKYKGDDIAKAMFGDSRDTFPTRVAVAKLAALAKGHMVPVPRKKGDVVPPATITFLDELIDRHQIQVPSFSGDNSPQQDRVALCGHALTAMRMAADNPKAVDFDDMCWLPVHLDLHIASFDRVFVDETQDLTRVQIELVTRACREKGRICAVGDDRQAIYAFRGADERAVPGIISRLNARVMPLSVTYRCARAIVAVANDVVPDLEAAPNAAEGEVHDVTRAQMHQMAQPGDFIISRTNAPMIGLCLAFLREGRKANIAGRDVGANLIGVIKRSEAATIPALIEYIGRWREEEVERLEAAKRDTTAAHDKAECIIELTEGCRTIEQVIDRIKELFSDGDDGKGFARDYTRIILGTTHKLKGLERPRVFALQDTYRPGQGGEEANLWYVAVTRAQFALYRVAGPNGPGFAPPRQRRGEDGVAARPRERTNGAVEHFATTSEANRPSDQRRERQAEERRMNGSVDGLRVERARAEESEREARRSEERSGRSPVPAAAIKRPSARRVPRRENTPATSTIPADLLAWVIPGVPRKR